LKFSKNSGYSGHRQLQDLTVDEKSTKKKHKKAKRKKTSTRKTSRKRAKENTIRKKGIITKINKSSGRNESF